MAFPADRLPVTVEIAPGADPAGDPGTWTWVDITSSVRLRDRIRITQGRADEAARVAPSTCRLRLDNRTGNFTPRNPLGAYYGTLGRNTPLRVRLQWAKDTFTRTVSNGWGSADTGQAWTTSGGSASDYNVNGVAHIGDFNLATVSVAREAQLGLDRATVDILATHVKVPVAPTGNPVELNMRARFVDGNNYVAARLFVLTDNTITCNIQSVTGGSATNTGFPVVPGVTATTTLSMRFQAIGATLRLRVWQSGQPEPSTWNVTLTATHLAAGGLIWRAFREAGNTNAAPYFVELDGLTVTNDRFSGFVSAWPPRWDKSGRDATVPIEANGLLRRLGQGAPPAHSPMRRSIPATDPVAYWPCEDGTAANWAASAFIGHSPLAVSGTVAFRPVSDYEVVSSTPGTSALIDLSGGGTLTAALPASVTAATTSAFSASVTVDLDTATMSGDLNLLEVHTPGGTFARWVLRLTTGLRTRVVAITSAGAETVVADALGVTTSFVTMDFSVWQNGGNIDAGVQWFGDPLNHFADDGSVAGTLTGATMIKVNSTGVTQTPALPCGHLTMWTTHPAPILDDPRISYEDEAVHDRISRLCEEEGLTVALPTVSSAFSTLMGPQPAATFLDLLYECAEADQGIIYESGFGLGYLPREYRYNRDTALALDFDLGQVAEPPEPTDDDQQLRNRVTVRRTGGSSATAEDTDSIAEVGLYETEVTVNHADDTQLYDHAAWRVHLGT